GLSGRLRRRQCGGLTGVPAQCPRRGGLSAAQPTGPPGGPPAAALVICAALRAPTHEVCPHGHSSRAHGVGVAPRRHAVASGGRGDCARNDHGRAPWRASRAGADGAAARTNRPRVGLLPTRPNCAPGRAWRLRPQLGRPALAGMAVDLVWAPPVTAMYPSGFATRIVPEGPAAAGLEDKFRPHFFAGVATVVGKLLIQCAPDIAMFGEKDYQQLKVVTRLAK